VVLRDAVGKDLRATQVPVLVCDASGAVLAADVLLPVLGHTYQCLLHHQMPCDMPATPLHMHRSRRWLWSRHGASLRWSSEMLTCSWLPATSAALLYPTNSMSAWEACCCCCCCFSCPDRLTHCDSLLLLSQRKPMSVL
jgi:hypothetical protein